MLTRMLHAVDVDRTTRTATVRLEGALTGADVLDALLAVLDHPDWRPGFSTLWDARDVHSVTVRPEDLEAFAARAEAPTERRGPGRTAIVTRDPHVRLAGSLMAMKTKLGPEREFLIFSHLGLARRWLLQAA